MDKQPVLFVLIGWALRYDGTEAVKGGHKYLDSHSRDSEEAEAFVQRDDGLFYCGAGKGQMHEKSIDTVFIARHPTTRSYEVVAIYRGAEAYVRANQWSELWCTVKTADAVLFPVGRRPVCAHWPTGQGMRRWARRLRSKGASHQGLLATYRSALSSADGPLSHATESSDIELDAFEGEQRQFFFVHRKREAKLRAAKIRQALSEGDGHLRCEVPGCGFDFLDTYGEDGRNFAIVHHKRPLSWVPSGGAKTSLTDLAIVCANCHAMVHRGGECREIAALIQKKL